MVPPTDPPEVLERFHGNLDLVDLIARQLSRDLGRAAELEDLRALGHQGLLEAARRFDANRGVSFRRFANYRIRGAMLDGVRKSAPLPRRAYARVRALEAALLVAEETAEATASASVPSPGSSVPPVPSPEEAERRLTSHLADMATAMAMGLLATPTLGEEGEWTALDGHDTPEEELARAELKNLVLRALEGLEEDEKALIKGHYIDGERFDHVAARLGLSKSWGSRLHTRAIARLTKRLRAATR